MTSFENLVMSINEFFFDDFYTKLNDIVNSSSKLKKRCQIQRLFGKFSYFFKNDSTEVQYDRGK